MEAWLGALALGARPAAIPPPGVMGSPESHTAKVAAVVEQVGASTLVASPRVCDALRQRSVAGTDVPS